MIGSSIKCDTLNPKSVSIASVHCHINSVSKCIQSFGLNIKSTHIRTKGRFLVITETTRSELGSTCKLAE